MNIIEKCKQVGYENLTHSEQFEVFQMSISTENEEEADLIDKLIPLDPITEKTFRLVFGDHFIKEQGYLLEGQRNYG